MRTVLSAGAPVPVSLLRRVQALVPDAELHTPYGMTEALPVTDVSLAQIEEAGSGNGVCVGSAVPGVEIRISALDESAGPTASWPSRSRRPARSASRRRTSRNATTGCGPPSGRARAIPAGTERATSGTSTRRADCGSRDVSSTSSPDRTGPITPVGIEQRVEAAPGVRAAAAVGVGPAGTQQLIVIVVPEQAAADRWPHPTWRRTSGRPPASPVAAVLTVDALPVDIRHASKVDRLRLARWAERVLGGGRVGRP